MTVEPTLSSLHVMSRQSPDNKFELFLNTIGWFKMKTLAVLTILCKKRKKEKKNLQ